VDGFNLSLTVGSGVIVFADSFWTALSLAHDAPPLGVLAEPDLRGPRGPGSRHPNQQRVSHQTVRILFLANDRCLRDYELVVARC